VAVVGVEEDKVANIRIIEGCNLSISNGPRDNSENLGDFRFNAGEIYEVKQIVGDGKGFCDIFFSDGKIAYDVIEDIFEISKKSKREAYVLEVNTDEAPILEKKKEEELINQVKYEDVDSLPEASST
jgi:hypothetical protein